MTQFSEPGATSSGPRALRLEVHAGPLAGKGFPFSERSITFGRAPDNDVTLDDSQVSRHHAILRKQGEQIILEDLGSTNGTFANNERIYAPHTLQPTETITIGTSLFSLSGFSAPATVGMAADKAKNTDWQTYQRSGSIPVQGGNPANWLLWAGLAILILLVVAIVGASIWIFTTAPQRNNATVPTVIIQAPVNGSQIRIGQLVRVQATATDSQGITRMELWIAGQKIAQATSPNPNGQNPFTTVNELTWTPASAGNFTLEVRAFNRSGGESAPTTLNLTVIDVQNVPPTPTATPSQEPTPTGSPFGVVRTDLNVRSGPGTQYEIIGRLDAGSVIPIIGKSSDNFWWQIDYPPAPDGHGWVAAEYAPSPNGGLVPIAPPPTPTLTPTPPPVETPTPTPTATNTPVPPTNTPNVPTSTPTPPPGTATPTLPPPSEVLFLAEPELIDEGECATIMWLVRNVKAVYFEDQGVPGEAGGGQPMREERCPEKTTTYQLRVIGLDDKEETYNATVSLNTRPQAPSNLATENIGETRFTLDWDDNSDNETGFSAYNADENNIVAEFAENQTNGIIDGLFCGSSYRFYLVAYNDLGESAPSEMLTIDTIACP